MISFRDRYGCAIEVLLTNDKEAFMAHCRSFPGFQMMGLMNHERTEKPSSAITSKTHTTAWWTWWPLTHELLLEAMRNAAAFYSWSLYQPHHRLYINMYHPGIPYPNEWILSPPPAPVGKQNTTDGDRHGVRGRRPAARAPWATGALVPRSPRPGTTPVECAFSEFINTCTHRERSPNNATHTRIKGGSL